MLLILNVMSHESDSESIIMSLREWRQAVMSPPSYRIGNSSFRINTKHFTILIVIGLSVLILLYYGYSSSSQEDVFNHMNLVNPTKHAYNSTYPLTKPVRTPTGITYRIGVISDLDTNSSVKKDHRTWISYLQKGYLIWNPSMSSVTVSWDKTSVQLESTLSQGGRGMELSELLVFNGKLYAFDDRTGVVYEIVSNRVVPWVVLADGNGQVSKGFKAEWATIKDQKLYIGGLGKEYTNNKGDILNYDPQWIKTVTVTGEVEHKNWRENYLALRDRVGIQFPGYMIHESCNWSNVHKKWFFLPRRCSKLSYRDDTDELMGTNLLLKSDDLFKNIEMSHIGDVIPSRGFSSFKFLPGSDDEIIVAIKSEEVKGSTASYITAFTIHGKILLPETKIADVKYEGIEFL